MLKLSNCSEYLTFAIPVKLKHSKSSSVCLSRNVFPTRLRPYTATNSERLLLRYFWINRHSSLRPNIGSVITLLFVQIMHLCLKTAAKIQQIVDLSKLYHQKLLKLIFFFAFQHFMIANSHNLECLTLQISQSVNVRFCFVFSAAAALIFCTICLVRTINYFFLWSQVNLITCNRILVP